MCNGICHPPGSHYLYYYPGALSLSQDCNSFEDWAPAGARSSNELQRLDCMIGYQDSSQHWPLEETHWMLATTETADALVL